MKKLILLALVSTLVNCSITQKPQVEKVKKMAIVSVYANKDFYDIDTPPAEDMGLPLIAGTDKLLGLDTAPNSPEILGTLMLNAQASFEKELGRVAQWQIVPHDQVRSNPALKSFQLSLGKEQGAMLNSMNEKLAKSTAGTVSLDLPYLVTPGLVLVPSDKIATVVIGGGKSPTEDLAELAKALNVDAVLVIELDIAYDEGGAFSLFKDEVTISSAIYGVDTQGEFVIKSQDVQPGGGKRFEGDEKVKHVKRFSMDVSKLGGDVGVPILSENNAIVQYNKAIEKNAKYFADEIISELE